MSRFAARFFAYLQGAEFYRAVHAEAVALLPTGAGRTWLDMGCGPGLVARLAADRMYSAVGRDIDPNMVAMARHIGRRSGSSARFETGGVALPLPHDQLVDVVSAASLLFVLSDRATALRQMLAQLKQDGVLLIVETTPAMRLSEAWRWLLQKGYSRRAWMLLLWAWVRGGRAVSEQELNVHGWQSERVALMGGLVAAWVVRAGNGDPSR